MIPDVVRNAITEKIPALKETCEGSLATLGPTEHNGPRSRNETDPDVFERYGLILKKREYDECRGRVFLFSSFQFSFIFSSILNALVSAYSLTVNDLSLTGDPLYLSPIGRVPSNLLSAEPSGKFGSSVGCVLC